jgi:hypothetical protein
MAATSNERNNANPDQIIVGILRDVQEGDTFERIPEHVTLLHWFSLNQKYQGAFENALINQLHDTAPLQLIGEGRDLFEPEHTVPVTTLKLGALAAFHTNVLELVGRFEGTVHSEHIGEEYVPHVSDTDTFQFEVGEQRTLERVQLVSMDRETGMRRIEKNLSLTGGKHGAPTARF